MWESIKQWLNTPKVNPIEQAYIAQSRALIDLVKQQQETLDRIVTAKYDRPVVTPTPREPDTMPQAMLYDGPGLLAVESDEEFLKGVGVE